MKICGITVHPSVTADRVVDNPGMCLACGQDADGCEPDARKYDCEHCGEAAVFGAQELLFHFVA